MLSRVLLELNTADDPVWVYFDSQHTYILNRMQESHEACLKTVNGEYAPPL